MAAASRPFKVWPPEVSDPGREVLLWLLSKHASPVVCPSLPFLLSQSHRQESDVASSRPSTSDWGIYYQRLVDKVIIYQIRVKVH